MNKRILFVCYGLGIGGIEKCMVNLINVMPDNFNIDILLMNPQYTFKNQIKRSVRFLDTFDYVMNIEDTVGEIRSRKGIVDKIRMTISYCLYRLRIKFHKDAWVGFKPIPEKYDVAIAYSHHDFSPYYVVDKVCADKKVMWYHNGAYEHEGFRYERDKKYFTQFDKVVAVSTDCAKILNEKFSFKDGQLCVLKNICDEGYVKARATDFVPNSFINKEKGIHIVSVGRMTPEKGADLALEACKILCDKGYEICWHWVGDGNQANVIRKKIDEYGLAKNFLLEGNQDNPYPFINFADIYVQPSYYEAYSTTITEAKVLKRPIVTTDVGGMRDQLIQGKNGIIVPIEAEAISNAIKLLIDDISMRKTFQEKLEKEDFSPEKSLIEYERIIFCED